MRKAFLTTGLLLAALNLGGCSDLFFAAPPTDTTIKIVSTPSGLQALPPDCPDWRAVANGPTENTQWPQYGCANARNLAAHVIRTEDLYQGRDSGPANGETTASAMDRYILGKTKPLIDPNAKAPVLIATPTGGAGVGGGGGMQSGGK